ncbi:MAG: DUF374 domain-containing protein [Hyphomicrobiales bacterium]
MIHSAAFAWGRLVGAYSRSVVAERNTEPVMDCPLPGEPTIWLGWHEANLITIALHRFIVRRPVVAFAPSALKGSAVRGWLQALGVGVVPIGEGAAAGVTLRVMRRALREGHDVMIAADGPAGPRRMARPGALWLASALSKRVAPVGCAASPAFRLPRWDRHIVPLPGAHVVAIFGAPIRLEHDPRSPEACGQVSGILDGLMTRSRGRLARIAGGAPVPSPNSEAS